MSFSYPNFNVNYNITDEELIQLYNSINTWASEIKFLLESRDIELDARPSTKIYSVVTVTEIGRPQSGYVAYSASSGKFKGYVNNAWVDFH
jgi:hypothetical protein